MFDYLLNSKLNMLRFTKHWNLVENYFFVIRILFSCLLAELFVYFQFLTEFKNFRSILRYAAVVIIFFTSGLNATSENIQFSKHLRMTFASQIFNYLIISLIIKIILFFVGYFLIIDHWILTGFVSLACISQPLSSAVLLTKVSKGNEIAAVFNAGCGCLIGTVLTPLLLLFHVGISCIVPVKETFLCLVAFGGLPFMFGFCLRDCPHSGKFQWLTSFAHTTLAFTSFYQVFLETELVVSAHDVLTTFVIVIILQVILMALSVRFAIILSPKKNRFTTEDVIAIMFCSVNKSLTIGLPLLKTLYGGYSHLSQISLPLLIYHPVQLILGALVSPFAHSWISGLTNSVTSQ